MNCHACSHSYTEPDSGLICGHKDAGWAGLTIHTEPLAHCGWRKFEQHPLRNSDGTLRNGERSEPPKAPQTTLEVPTLPPPSDSKG